MVQVVKKTTESSVENEILTRENSRKCVNTGNFSNPVYTWQEAKREALPRNSFHILQICGSEDVLVYVKRKQENYLEHITKQKNTSIMEILLFDDDQNKKRVDP